MWTSKTGQFGGGELGVLERATAGQLAERLLLSDPVVVVRALAEIQGNGAAAKLRELLDNPQLTEHWRAYTGDSGVDSRDHAYAAALEALL